MELFKVNLYISNETQREVYAECVWNVIYFLNMTRKKCVRGPGRSLSVTTRMIFKTLLHFFLDEEKPLLSVELSLAPARLLLFGSLTLYGETKIVCMIF